MNVFIYSQQSKDDKKYMDFATGSKKQVGIDHLRIDITKFFQTLFY